MKHNFFIIIFLLFYSCLIYSEDTNRFFQFISKDENESYIALDAGTASGVTLSNKNINLSFQYYVNIINGFSISTDLFVAEISLLNKLKFNTGLGFGIIISPSIDTFFADIVLRLPLQVEYNNFRLSVIPMVGATLFDYKTKYVYGATISVSYLFKTFYKENEVLDSVVKKEKKTTEK